MAKQKSLSLKLENVGPIKDADVTFGDLTVFVGPQATGKSIFLQFLKLVLDTGYVHDQLLKHGIDWKSRPSDFLDVYLGGGMNAVWQSGRSKIWKNGREMGLQNLVYRGWRKKRTVFHIPAQRVLTLANGWPRPFQGFSSEDPFAVRDFSERFRLLMEQELAESEVLFPKPKRLKQEYRNLLSKHLFGSFGLCIDRHVAQKRLVLRQHSDDQQEDIVPPIPFMAWSAGQREFVPLLLGLYWLMPSAQVKRRRDIVWAIIEELEMGLHPNAISVVLLLVLELLWRGYRVCLSTHSPHVLDLVWAIRTIKKHKPDVNYLLDIFQGENDESLKTEPLKKVARSVLKKEIYVYYFDSKGNAHDISDLDPGAEDKDMAGWGGLTEFTGRVNDIVAQVVAKASREPSTEPTEEPPELLGNSLGNEPSERLIRQPPSEETAQLPENSLPPSNQPSLPQIEGDNL